jgi:hypothetical protein
MAESGALKKWVETDLLQNTLNLNDCTTGTRGTLKTSLRRDLKSSGPPSLDHHGSTPNTFPFAK